MNRDAGILPGTMRAGVRSLPALLVAAALGLPFLTSVLASSDASLSSVKVHAAFARLPLAFEVNRGQAHARVRFLARGRGYSLLLTATETVLALAHDGTAVTRSHADVIDPSHVVHAPARGEDVVRLRFVGANPHPLITGRSPLPGQPRRNNDRGAHFG